MFKILLAQKIQSEKGSFSYWVQYSAESRKNRDYEYWLRIREALNFELPRRLAYLNQIVDHPECSVLFTNDPKHAIQNSKLMIKLLEKNFKTFNSKAEKEIAKFERKLQPTDIKKSQAKVSAWLKEFIDGPIEHEKNNSNKATVDLSAFVHIGTRQLSML